MSHDDFILGYQSGRLGCGVSTLLILRLFLVGRIHETRVVIRLVGWSLGLLLLIGLTTIGFLCLPALWALLGTIILLAIFALAFTHQVSGLIVSTALTETHFYQFALAECALLTARAICPNCKKLLPCRPLVVRNAKVVSG
jgi:hypothetical protein